ncbi:MAG: LecA/PA-IL family lectin, partial [Pyrinomonadaceae bacterium]
PPVVVSQPKTTAPVSSGSAGQPIELSVKVLADNTANGWTNSGWVVRKGQRIKITGDGEISLGNGNKTSAAGLPDLADDQKLLKGVATGALIAVIGDDNNDFIYVGAEREFTATRDGTLFLGVNESNLNDNSGSFDVKIQILPTNGK